MYSLRRTCWLMAALLLVAGCEPEVSSDPEILAQLPERVDYNFHIKPLLSDRCFACHGPDEAARKAALRLDVEQEAKAKRPESGAHALVSGSLRRSDVYRRITSDDPLVQMPPPESNLALTPYERALLARWIEQGAAYEPHWAFIPPQKPAPPPVAREEWVRNPIDRFVLARLEREGLAPSPEAERERLLRRVTFDLTGLPPTPAEMDAFLADRSPGAYEKVVDRLLASEAFGERLTVDWMDLARYADSHGYHADGYRHMWPWRDWVIRAFNDNMPYDRFVTWQLAGDLLPKPTRDQILATAFNRNHPMTAEGGVIDEEYRLEYVADRTNTFGRAFLGLTVECARCHDHKYDPITQKEYYQMSAFFNNVKELGMTGNDGDYGPTLLLPEAEVEAELAALRARIEEAEKALARRLDEAAARAAFVEAASSSAEAPGLVGHYPLDDLDGGVRNVAGRRRPGGVEGDVEIVPGRHGGAARFDSDFEFLTLDGVGRYDRYEPFSLGAWVHVEARAGFSKILGNAGNKDEFWRGYDVTLDSLNRVSVRLVHTFPHNYLHVRSRTELPVGAWTHLLVTYDGSSRARGIRLYVDGRSAPLETLHDELYKTIQPTDILGNAQKRWIRVGRGYRAFTGDEGIFSGRIDDIRVYDGALTAIEAARLAGAEPPGDRRARAAHHLARADRAYRQELEALEELRRREHERLSTVDEVMVMGEMERPRVTHVLERGAYDAPRERVEPGTPEAILAMPASVPRNRLGLAEWLFEPDHPLTARVAVNRYWQLLFGRGLVETQEDFGAQGRLPTHPELLDYLAVTFRESGWDLKALLRIVVTSSTYRQSSRATPALRERDPENVLLARGPSYRMPAEMIRDNALAASGLLVRRVGGPSAKPYQPEGLWEEKGVFSQVLRHYRPSTGEELYRRSLYTFIRRTAPPPMMTAFDAPDRSYCLVRRQSTNTPMQALVLLNDPQFVEAARLLAERMQREGGAALDERIAFGFRLLTGRRPRPEERGELVRLYEAERARFARDLPAARALLAVGEYPRDPTLPVAETAAFAVVANLMMNHDDAYMKR